VVVSLERMRRILSVDCAARLLTCQAGVTLERVQQEAAGKGMYFPVDFSSRGSSQIGGNISTNAGGIRVLRYGNIREWVVGLTVVTGRGEVLQLNGCLFKNNAGVDLRPLFIGSEGTLGIITECTMRLTTRPVDYLRAMCGLGSLDTILPLLSFCRSRLPSLSAFELLERDAFDEVVSRRSLRNPFQASYQAYILIECEQFAPTLTDEVLAVLTEAFESGLTQDIVVGESSAHSQELMNIRDLVSETLSSHYTLHKNDISVPISDIPSFLNELHTIVGATYPGYRVLVFGHVGDGNLHVNILKPPHLADEQFWDTCKESDKIVFSLVRKYRGSIAAEHGVGLLKRDYLEYTRTSSEIRVLKELKAVFDPNGVLNPGKVLPA
jgi:FAD/FMN-containing dehydrogenase